MPALRPEWARRAAAARGARLHPVPAAGARRPDEALLKRPLLLAGGWTWAGAIVWLSLTPSPPEAGFDGGDKLGHLLAYAILMGWFCALYRRTPVRVSYGLAFIGMGIALEFAQGALGTRAFEVPDMLANSAGVLAGWAAALAGHRILRR